MAFIALLPVVVVVNNPPQLHCYVWLALYVGEVDKGDYRLMHVNWMKGEGRKENGME